MDNVVLFKCPDCKERKPRSAFHYSSYAVSGKSGYCIECTAIRSRAYYIRTRERQLEKARLYKLENPDVSKRSRLKVKYGITIEAHTAMLQLQFYKCASCGDKFDPESPMKRACVDHDHETKQVRELLCAQCNLLAQEDIDRLAKVVAYLKRHGK